MVKTKHHGNHGGWRESNHMRRPNIIKSELERSILSCLSRQRVSLKAVQIAKAVGMVTAKDVNPTLYSLAKVNKVICVGCDGKAPVWRLGAPLTEATSSQPGFCSLSSNWTMVKQNKNVIPFSGPADASVHQVPLLQSDTSHVAGFHCAASMVHSAGRGIPTETRVHQSRCVMNSPGGSVKVHTTDSEVKPMSEDASCSTVFGQPVYSQQNLRSVGDETQSQGTGMCTAEEQYDENNIENLMISCEPGIKEDSTTGQCDQDVPGGHCDTGMAGAVREAADAKDTSSGGSTEDEKDDTSNSAVLNDQVRLLRALSTSDDEQSVPSCPEDFTKRAPVFSIGQSGCTSHETPLQKRILQYIAMSPKQHCSALHLVHSLHLSGKNDINATLSEMNKRGLINKVNETPPRWQMAPAGRSLLQDHAVGRIPRPPTSLTNDVAFGTLTSQKLPTTHASSPFRIPLSPAEMVRSRSLYDSTPGASSSFCPFGFHSEPLVYQRIGIGRGIKLVQNTQTAMQTAVQTVGHGDSEKLLNALKVHEPVPTSVAPLMKTGTQNTQEALTLLSSESFAALNKNPVSALMEFAQSRKMTATVEVFGQTGPPHNPRFRMAAVVGGRQFPYITVSNKKDGKKERSEELV